MDNILNSSFLIPHYINRTVPFKFRGIGFSFDLSQGLFSSACVDAGTLFLLKVFSRVLDEDVAAGRPMPMRVLDAGCGTGVIGICAASAISALAGENGLYTRCQDRDELARLVTSRNAAKNNIPPSTLEAFTEPLLAGPANAGWDLILTNIPAKAGSPVLEDFVSRSASLLNPNGRVIMVVVNTLADFFREAIAASAELLSEEKGPGHTVFVYCGKAENPALPVNTGTGFLNRHPFYLRESPACTIEGIQIRLETIHGASGFDNPGGAVLAAAKLLRRLGHEKIPNSGDTPFLVHEPGQGFFTNWLLEFLRAEAHEAQKQALVLSGRNILSLEAARHNADAQDGAAVSTVSAVDLQLGRQALLEAGGGQFAFIAAFPELLPQNSMSKAAKASQDTDQLTAIWNSLPLLLAAGGIILAAFSSSDAERFDRKKPSGFTRLGSVKRNGFCALSYLCTLPDASPAASFCTSSTDT
jgi:SAM-dependent methyltransferase